MKRWWSVVAARIDAFSLRERVMIFASALACCMAVVNVLWLTPVQTAYKQLTQRFVAQNTELQKLQNELASSRNEAGPGSAMRNELMQIKTRLEVVNQQIAKMPAATPGETSLSKVLVHFLRRYEGLTLVRTTTLALDPKVLEESAAAGLHRQGLELTVAGSYPQLIRYVQTLERAMPALRWGSMKIDADKQPVLLTLQVSLVEKPR